MHLLVNTLAATLVTLSFLTGCQTAPVEQKSGTNLSDKDVTDLISGHTVDATNTKGKKYRIYFESDGSLVNATGETGTWEVREGSICNTYDERGSAGCDKLFRDDSNAIYYIVPNGKTGTIESTTAGNKL